MREELIRQRKKHQFTQSQIAKQLNISTRMYQYLEAGQRKGKMELWLEISSILNTSIEKLYLQRNDSKK